MKRKYMEIVRLQVTKIFIIRLHSIIINFFVIINIMCILFAITVKDTKDGTTIAFFQIVKSF